MADIGGDGASLMMGGFDPSAFTGEFCPRWEPYGRVPLQRVGVRFCPLKN